MSVTLTVSRPFWCLSLTPYRVICVSHAHCQQPVLMSVTYTHDACYHESEYKNVVLHVLLWTKASRYITMLEYVMEGRGSSTPGGF
jgi:hypothetical protein